MPTDTNNPVRKNLVDCLKQLQINFLTAISFRNEVLPIHLLTSNRHKEQRLQAKINFPQNLAKVLVWFSVLLADS